MFLGVPLKIAGRRPAIFQKKSLKVNLLNYTLGARVAIPKGLLRPQSVGPNEPPFSSKLEWIKW